MMLRLLVQISEYIGYHIFLALPQGVFMPALVASLSIIFKKLFFAACGIFGVGFVIAFHELGHFMFCKLFNIEVPSFSIGFGPRLITKKIGETEFAISALPVGGYVEIGGASEEQGPLTERSFARKPWYQKMLVMIGGIGFNIVFTYIALSLLFMVGMPQSPLLYPLNATTTVAAVVPESPAELAGLKQGDTLVRSNGAPIADSQVFVEYVMAHPQTQLTLEIQHADGSLTTKEITTSEKMAYGKRLGTLGVMFEMRNLEPASLIQALKHSITMTHTMIKNTFYAYKHIIFKKDVSQVGGPIMIISETMTGASKGIKVLLLFLAFISVTLAILNLIPLPILDGGQMLFYTIEAIIRRPLPFNVRWYIHIATWIAFMLLTLYLSVKDIARLINPYLESILKLFGF